MKNKKMKVAIYTRVSTLEQAKEGFSLNAQEERLKAFCVSQDWEIVEIYREEGESAKNLRRKKLRMMLSDLDRFDVVLVYKLDRISRSVLDVNSLIQEFEKHNVAFKSATEPYDTTTSQGRMFINIIASLAQFEREQLAERVYMGMNEKLEEGQRPGGKSAFGYDKNENVVEEEMKWVRFMFDRIKTKGTNTIAIELNERGSRTRGNRKKKGSYWDPRMVKYIVSNPIYCGMVRWDGTLIKGTHEAIISKEEFDDIQNIMKSRYHSGFKGTVHFPFTGIAYCKRCGAKMQGITNRNGSKQKVRYYRCSNRKLKRCDQPQIMESLIEEKFLNMLDVNDFELTVEDDTDVQESQKELKRTRQAIERVKQMFKWGDISELEYRKEVKELQQKESRLSSSLSNTTTIGIDDIKRFLQDIQNNWTFYTFEERKKFLRTFVDRFIVDVTNPSTSRYDQATVEVSDIQFRTT